VWLMLADLSSRYRWQTPSPTECLKMSYYMGPHEEALIPTTRGPAEAAASQLGLGVRRKKRSRALRHN
jgi:hypothetical protein